ncbi:amino acid ABC transporter substrate-binding protein [Thalassotalea sp. M1531]|uniref:Amino acid ABC transporter substrate-binding protein n=1 Tax=Thalassotalea algicola TaxID=2716224 RepID=A0A7Y0Q8A0_9GAMM|nr:hypothetical protein [Thalassotalea algicola]NMP31910.1 amino acid ABC transporter substrate-binding protein [Thalassotalea algicola]
MVFNKYITTLLFVFSHSLSVCAEESLSIKVMGAQSIEDASYEYFRDLLTLALDKSKALYPYKAIEIIDAQNTTQGRSIKLLTNNLVNIHWAGTNNEREQELIPIKIPLFKGLLGYRVSIVHRDNLNDFSNITEVELKQKLACQGEHWPDSDILEDNGYQVIRVSRFDLMFKMLAQKRCDYFPRAIFEGYAELKAAKERYPELVMYDELVLHYPFPIYFFTNTQNKILAEQIEYGLIQALEDGSITMLRKSHAATLNLFPLAQWRNKRYFHLTNRTLPASTDTNNEQLWLKLYP